VTRTAGATARVGARGRAATWWGSGTRSVSSAVSGRSGSGSGVRSPGASRPVSPASSRISGDGGSSHILSRGWCVGTFRH